MGFAISPQTVSPTDLATLKTDRHYLEYALAEAGILLNNKATQIDGDACKCPFHNDNNPSGGLHQVCGNGDWIWLYTCHGCPDKGGEWNNLNPDHPSNSGDAIAVLRSAHKRKGQELSFADACQMLRKGAQRRYTGLNASSTVITPPKCSGPSQAALERVEAEATHAHQTLLNSPDLLALLWNQRAVDKDTAARFRVGYTQDTGGRAWWSFRVTDADHKFIAVKYHAADGGQPKCFWSPKGAKTGDVFFPIHTGVSGPIWLCPGELKALAVISLGLPAVGITSGEQTKWLPDKLLRTLNGRQVAVVADNDAVGRAWARFVCTQLAGLGMDVRLVDLGFTSAGEDIGDWITQRRVTQGLDVGAVAGEIVNTFESTPTFIPTRDDTQTQPDAEPEQSPLVDNPEDFTIRSIGDVWAEKTTWAPVERITTHITKLDDVLTGGFRTRGVHLVVGKAGAAKTQLAVQIAVNAAQNGVPVGFVSLEMDRGDIGRLALAQITKAPRRIIDYGLQQIRNRQIAGQIKQAMQTFHSLPLDIIDGVDFEHGFTRHHLAAVVEKGVEKQGWRLILLDHLGELAPTDTDPAAMPLLIDKMNASVLRSIARHHNVAFVAVAPLRKGAKFKDGKIQKITLDDVLGAGAIGYTISSCLAVTAKYRPQPSTSEIEISILKNRYGRTPEDAVALTWLPECGRIFDP
ncbi:MAG: DnaB-like helicase C-terminal domain-containing protein, partial [Phycisphaerae bacterium]